MLERLYNRRTVFWAKIPIVSKRYLSEGAGQEMVWQAWGQHVHSSKWEIKEDEYSWDR